MYKNFKNIKELTIDFANFREHLKPHRFVRNVATMLAGNASAQAITFAATLIITRLYTPEDFGMMTLISSIIIVLSVMSCFSYENAIVLPKEDNKAQNVFALSLLITATFSIFLLFVVLFLGESIANLVNKPGVITYLWFIPAGVFVYGCWQSLAFWQTRAKRFNLLSASQIVNSIAMASPRILAGLIIGSSAFWLITGNILGPLSVVILLGVVFLKEHLPGFKRNVSKKEIFRVAKEFKKFPRYNVWSNLLSALSQNLPVFLFAYYFSQEIVGFYGLASAVLRKPAYLMGQSVSKVFLQKAAETQANGQNLRDHLTKVTTGLAAIGIIPFGILAVGGSWIFSIVFGQQWATAGLYAQFLAPWLFLGCINPPSTQIILVKQKLRFKLYFETGYILLRVLAIVIGYHLSPQPWVAIALFSATGVLANIYYIVFAFSLTREAKKTDSTIYQI